MISARVDAEISDFCGFRSGDVRCWLDSVCGYGILVGFDKEIYDFGRFRCGDLCVLQVSTHGSLIFDYLDAEI